jgi:hypothetical protein
MSKKTCEREKWSQNGATGLAESLGIGLIEVTL